jgi:glycosyltransferase involved in cell wall biosynthesis
MTEKSVFNPKVSIVIPVYNGSNYMREAIDSALAQTYENIEVIVVNDGSNDNGKTRDIALSYGDKIRYFEKENGGVASALNLGIEKMTGEYFSWLSHDDVYLINKIEEQVNYLKGLGRKIVVLFSDFELVDDKLGHIQTVLLSESDLYHFQMWITIYSALNGCTLLIPKECFERCGNFNPNLCTTQDYDLWFRIANYYEYFRVPKVLVRSRQHNHQATKSLPAVVKEECNNLVLNFFLNLCDEKCSRQESLIMAKSFFKRGYYYASYSAFKHLLKMNNFKMNVVEKIIIFTYVYLSYLMKILSCNKICQNNRFMRLM